MEQLEIMHLAPSLPYGLMTDKGKLLALDLSNTRNNELDATALISMGPVDLYDTDFRLSEFYSILRPISDLVIENSFNPEWNFIFEDYFDEYYAADNEIILEHTSNGDPEMFHYPVVQRLFEHHFDVFGLIEKGLAIDINSLGK